MNDIVARRSMTDGWQDIEQDLLRLGVSGRTGACVRCQAAAVIFASQARPSRMTALAIISTSGATEIRATPPSTA
jgi:hypothetical protein